MGDILGTTLKWVLVGRNVAESVIPFTPDTHEIKPLTVEEVKRLLKVLEYDRLYAFYVHISTTGIRRGEALGLQKESLNLEEGTVTIVHSLTQINGKGLTLGKTKTAKSRRELALPEFTVKVLKKHLETYSKY